MILAPGDEPATIGGKHRIAAVGNSATSFSVVTSQMRTTASSLPEARRFPSGEDTTALSHERPASSRARNRSAAAAAGI